MRSPYMGLIAALLMLSVLWIPQGGISADTRDGELILNVAIQDNIKTYNPLVADDIWTWKVIDWVFDGLVWRNNTNNEHIEPWAAEWFHRGPQSTWDTSVGYADNDDNTDYRNWTVKLRDGIKWHDWQSQDGDEQYVRAHDVIFSLRLMADVGRYAGDIDCLVARNPNGSIMYGRDLPENGTIRLISWNGENVTQLPYWVDLSSQRQYPNLPVVYVWAESDDLTLHYYLTYRYADFTWRTLSLPTFPERIWKDHVNEKMTWNSPECLVNFGPFRFVNWNFTAETGTLRTFRNYFHVEYDERGNPKPYIDGMRFKVYSNTYAAVYALKSGEVDYIAWKIDPAYIDDINSDPCTTMVRNTDLGFYYVAFNMRLPYMGYANYSSDDVRDGKVEYNGDYKDIGKPFRVAMAHFIDKQTMVHAYLQGFGTVGTSVVPPSNTFWYYPKITTYGYDPEKANKILDSYAPDTDGNGIREMPVIGEDEIRMIRPPMYDVRCPFADLIQSIVTAKGHLNFRSVPTQFGTIVDKISHQDFQMYMLSWSVPDPRSSARLPCDLFYSMNDAVNGGHNYPGYHNRSFDELCSEFMREPDIYERRNISYRMQQAIADDVPYVVLYYQDVLEAYNSSFWGWVPRYGSIFNRYSIMNIRDLGCPFPEEMSLSLPAKVVSGEPVEFAAYLYNKNTLAPMPGVEVSFSVEGVDIGSNITDSNGKASVTYIPPYVENNTAIMVEASVYDENTGITIKDRAIVLVIPKPPPEYEIAMEISGIPANRVLAVSSDERIPVSIRVINAHSGEPIGELRNGSGVNISVQISPATGASFEYENYSNGTFRYIFVGYVAQNRSVAYFVRITVTYIDHNLTVDATDDQIQFTVIGPEYKPTGYIPKPEPQESIGLYIAISGVALIIVAAALFVFFRRMRGKDF